MRVERDEVMILISLAQMRDPMRTYGGCWWSAEQLALTCKQNTQHLCQFQPLPFQCATSCPAGVSPQGEETIRFFLFLSLTRTLQGQSPSGNLWLNPPLDLGLCLTPLPWPYNDHPQWTVPNSCAHTPTHTQLPPISHTCSVMIYQALHALNLLTVHSSSHLNWHASVFVGTGASSDTADIMHFLKQMYLAGCDLLFVYSTSHTLQALGL